MFTSVEAASLWRLGGSHLLVGGNCLKIQVVRISGLLHNQFVPLAGILPQ